MTQAARVCTTAMAALTVILVLTTATEAKRAYGKSDSVPACTHCDKSKCPVIGPVPVQYCPPHSIVRDACGCCERCTALIVVPTAATKAHACTNVTCPSRQICMVNIQGLPVCRCPTEQMCRDFSPRQGKVCAAEGSSFVTFPSECHMRVAMCHSTSRKIKLLYRGACHDVSRIDDTPISAAAKLSRSHELLGWVEQATAATVATTATTAVPTTTAATTTPAASATTGRTKLKTSTAAVTTRPMTAAQTVSTTTQDSIPHTNADASQQQPQQAAGRGRVRVHDQGKKKEGGGRRDRAAAAAASAAVQANRDGHAIRHSGRIAKSRGTRASRS